MRTRHRVLRTIAAGAVVGVVVVASLVVLPSYLIAHVQCQPHALGNVTAWTPEYIEAAPYRSSVSVSEHDWVNTTRNGAWMNASGNSSALPNSSGNVTAGGVEASNWTIAELQNVSVLGLGSASPCPTSLVAVHGSPWEWMSGLSPPMASGLENDRALPTSLNTSWLCYFWNQSRPGVGWFPPACPESSTFNASFGSTIGTVNTCGSLVPKTMTVNGSALEVRIPFYWNDRELEVPAVVSLDPAAYSTWGFPGLTSFGTSLTFRYTFPVGGVWSYDILPAGTTGGAGLVFSFTSCSA